jgi:hypothetical protein
VKTAGRYVLKQFTVLNASHAQRHGANTSEWDSTHRNPPALVADDNGEPSGEANP